VIRSHAGRRHARAAQAPARKTFRKLVSDALFTSVLVAVVAGVAYWAALQWVDVFSPNYAPHTIATTTHYITFAD
jgi:hypothetical protein